MKHTISIILLCFFGVVVRGQVEAPEVIPPSPNAASLGKYLEIPVGLYTGIPSVSVHRRSLPFLVSMLFGTALLALTPAALLAQGVQMSGVEKDNEEEILDRNLSRSSANDRRPPLLRRWSLDHLRKWPRRERRDLRHGCRWDPAASPDVP